MNWNKYITKNELTQISEAIKNIETKSSVEIIAVIANRSSTIRHIKLILFLVLSICLFLVFQFLNEYYYIKNPSFYSLAGYFLLIPISFFLAKANRIQRVFIPRCDQKFQVETMAEREFYVQRLNLTQAKTGLLIYVSILEKRAIILTDEAISDKITNDSWQEVVNHIINGVHDKNLYEGLMAGIESFKLRLTELFPADKNNPDELPNHVILRELN